DEAGFGTLWCGEHVVMVDEPGSRYPYSHDGKITVPDGCSPPLDLAWGPRRAGMARVQSAQDADQRQVAPRRLSGSANGSEGGNTPGCGSEPSRNAASRGWADEERRTGIHDL